MTSLSFYLVRSLISAMLSSLMARVFGASRPESGVDSLAPLAISFSGSHGASTVTGMVAKTGLNLQGNLATQLAAFGIDIHQLPGAYQMVSSLRA